MNTENLLWYKNSKTFASKSPKLGHTDSRTLEKDV